jgi:alpha-galactosidase
MNQSIILTPKPAATPRINGAKIFGVRPGSPLLFKIPATGEKPLTYSIQNIPTGVQLDSKTGLLSGTLSEPGEYIMKITLTNSKGSATRDLKIICGDRICLTPPMGWNSWYVHSLYVSQSKIEAMAKAMVDSGLVDHGWTYINIDDCWQGRRDPNTKILMPNDKFPDMKKMCENVHKLGLKIGIYSTPWVGSYAGYYGGSIRDESCDLSEFEVEPKDRLEKNQIFGNPNELRKRLRFHGMIGCEEIDAKQFAEWGFDYLKYDWNPNDIPHVTKMLDALKKSGRDIVYSLSNSAPFALASEWMRLANLWRTTGDIQDTWGSISHIGFNQDKWVPFGGPGHWNDPDMLQVGMTNTPHLEVSDSRPSRLSYDEQYTQMSLWCLLAAPLLLSCDLPKLDEFTLSLLSNDEVIEINQDPLGIPAKTMMRKKSLFGKTKWQILVRPLEDGSFGVGIFNLTSKMAKFTLKWSDIKLQGSYRVRDLWRQRDLGDFDKEFSSDVSSHGVFLIKIQKI